MSNSDEREALINSAVKLAERINEDPLLLQELTHHVYRLMREEVARDIDRRGHSKFKV